MASSEPPAGSLKRKREIQPLGPPSQQLKSIMTIPVEPRPALRANIACNTCRRQKMRCDGPDKGLPCMRCKNAGVDCVFQKVPPTSGPSVPTTSRIASLESKMEIMQATQSQMHDLIQEILFELRRSPVKSLEPTAISSLDEGQGQRSQNVHPPSYNGVDGHADEDSPSSRPPSESVKLRTPLPSIRTLFSPCPTPSDTSPSSSLRSPPPGASHSHTSIVEGSHTNVSQRGPSTTPPGASVCTSTDTNSSGESGLKRLKIGECGSEAQVKWASRDVTLDNVARVQGRSLFAQQVLQEDVVRAWNSDDDTKTFGTAEASLIGERGLLSESEAKYLFDFFFEFCHKKIPIFEPKLDSFDSLLRRSPFCMCCLLMAAVKSRDGNKPTELQLKLWDQSMERAKESMFQRVRDLEVIQGLLLMSAWSESTSGTCWIVTGHAIRCSFEMGIHKALSKLASHQHNTDTEAMQILVCSARVWCALFTFEYMLSSGIGRQIMTGYPKTVRGARDTLLRHPLSNLSDIRLVSAVELLLIEYQILDTLPSKDSDDPRCQRHLQEGRMRMDAWEAEWDAVLAPKYSPRDYMRQTLSVQRNYSYMAIHMACTQRIISSVDLERCTDWEKRNCLTAVTAAKNIVRIAVEEKEYRASFRYSPTCFRSCLSFAGASVLRLGCILENNDYVMHLATELSQILEDVPTCRFKASFLMLLQERIKANDRDKASRPDSQLTLSMNLS